VGRLPDPLDDAVVVAAVRRAVGPAVALRADANRRWTLHQAIAFGRTVAEHDLQARPRPSGRCTGPRRALPNPCAALRLIAGRSDPLPSAVTGTVRKGIHSACVLAGVPRRAPDRSLNQADMVTSGCAALCGRLRSAAHALARPRPLQP